MHGVGPRGDGLVTDRIAGIRRWFGTGFKSKEEVEKEEQQRRDEINEERRVKGKKPLETTKREGEMGKA